MAAGVVLELDELREAMIDEEENEKRIQANFEYCASVIPKYAQILNERKGKSGAGIRYSLWDGALSWTDEIDDENDAAELRAVYARLSTFRSLVMQGVQAERFMGFFRELKQSCPDWVFFDEYRCSADMLIILNAFYEKTNKDFDKAEAEAALRKERNLTKE